MPGPNIHQILLRVKAGAGLHCCECLKDRLGLCRGIQIECWVEKGGDNEAGDENDANLVGCAMPG